MGLFGKSPDPKEQVNDWCKKLRKESNQVERQINGIRREEAKVTKSLKDAAKKGDAAKEGEAKGGEAGAEEKPKEG